MNRRQFTILSLGTLAGVVMSRKMGSLPILSKSVSSRADGVGIDLSGLFADPGDAKVIGMRYLAQYPDKRNPDVLIDELGLPPLEADKYDRNSLRRWVDESQRRDFALGHTVIVNKWILSRTEANLCALIALS